MNRRNLFPAAVGLAVFLVAAAWANHFDNGFHFDDSHTVVDNPYIRGLSFIPRFFVDGRTFSTLPLNQGYRPLVSTSLAVDYWLGGGLAPRWFHLSTFVALLVLLAALYVLFSAVLDESPAPDSANRWAALWGATLFCVHPAGAETVNYVIQRADLYVVLGWVTAMALFVRGGVCRRGGLYLVPFVLAGLSKPTALALPLLVALYLIVFERPRARDFIVTLLPALLTALALGALHARMTPPTYTTGATDGLGYRITQPFVALHFAHMFLWPSELSADTDWAVLSLGNPRVWVGFAFVAAVMAAAVVTGRRPEARAASFGLGWFVIAMLPTSLTPLAEVTNDHRMFAPFVGLSLVAAWAGRALWRRFDGAALARKAALGVVALVMVLVAAGGTHVRNRVWHDGDTLWADTVQKSPRNGRAWMNYGLCFMGRGDYPRALDCYQKSLALNPQYSYLHVNLGIVLGEMGRTAEAEQAFRNALALDTATANACYYYARWLDKQGRGGEAVAHLEEGLRRVPGDAQSETLLAEIYHRQGRGADLDRLVASLSPGDPVLPVARVHAKQAAAERGAALARAQADAKAQPSAATFLALSIEAYRARQYDACIAAARACLKRDARSAAAWNNICAASNDLGRWDDAIAAANAALAIDPTLQIARNNLAYAQKMKAASAKPPTP